MRILILVGLSLLAAALLTRLLCLVLFTLTGKGEAP